MCQYPAASTLFVVTSDMMGGTALCHLLYHGGFNVQSMGSGTVVCQCLNNDWVCSYPQHGGWHSTVPLALAWGFQCPKHGEWHSGVLLWKRKQAALNQEFRDPDIISIVELEVCCDSSPQQTYQHPFDHVMTTFDALSEGSPNRHCLHRGHSDRSRRHCIRRLHSLSAP